jgi:hypothetical protein
VAEQMIDEGVEPFGDSPDPAVLLVIGAGASMRRRRRLEASA